MQKVFRLNLKKKQIFYLCIRSIEVGGFLPRYGQIFNIGWGENILMLQTVTIGSENISQANELLLIIQEETADGMEIYTKANNVNQLLDIIKKPSIVTLCIKRQIMLIVYRALYKNTLLKSKMAITRALPSRFKMQYSKFNKQQHNCLLELDSRAPHCVVYQYHPISPLLFKPHLSLKVCFYMMCFYLCYTASYQSPV